MVNRAGLVVAINAAKAREKARHALHSACGARGTTTCRPRSAGGFDETLKAERRERAPQLSGGVDDRGPVHLLARIAIEHDAVWDAPRD